VPHLDLLLAEAHPTSFYRSPTGFTAASIAEDTQLYLQHCTVCHGSGGRGDGPAAGSLAVPPADLTASHLWMHSDGEMFWWLSHGIDAPEGGLAIPGFAAVLSDDQRWALIDIIRADNAGTTRSGTGNWAFPVQAPDFEAACDGRIVDLHDFQGQVVRLGISRSNAVTIQANPDTKAAKSRECEGEDATVAAAYALVSGIPARDLPAPNS